MKRQQRTAGAIVIIQLDEKYHCYARILEDALFAFYDSKSEQELSINDICSSPVLFIIAVYNHAVTKGRWIKIGKMPLESELLIQPKFYMRDHLMKGKFHIYYNGEMIPATREECEGLECCAVWEPEHVEDRLRDHYAGVPNKWVESLKIK